MWTIPWFLLKSLNSKSTPGKEYTNNKQSIQCHVILLLWTQLLENHNILHRQMDSLGMPALMCDEMSMDLKDSSVVLFLFLTILVTYCITRLITFGNSFHICKCR